MSERENKRAWTVLLSAPRLESRLFHVWPCLYPRHLLFRRVGCRVLFRFSCVSGSLFSCTDSSPQTAYPPAPLVPEFNTLASRIGAGGGLAPVEGLGRFGRRRADFGPMAQRLVSRPLCFAPWFVWAPLDPHAAPKEAILDDYFSLREGTQDRWRKNWTVLPGWV